MEHNGWIKIHRSIMEMAEWTAEPFTRGQAWVDLLLLANHKTGFIRRRGIMVAVERGQVGYSEVALAARWQWSKGKVRRFLSELARLSRISRKISQKTVPKNTSVSSLICIINYEKYQANGTEDGTEDGPKTVPEQEGKEEKEKNPRDFTSQISTLKERYPDQGTITRAFEAIQATRKSNRIADSVRVSILQSWGRFPVANVMEGLRTYLDKGYAAQGKDEKYLLGIIRNSGNGKQSPPASAPPTFLVNACPSCGRTVFDNERVGPGCIACAAATEVRP